MKTASVSTLRSNLSEYLNQTEAVMVTQSGQPKALLLPVAAGDDLERLFMANNPELSKLLEEADRRISSTGGIPHDEFWARIKQETVSGGSASPKRVPKGS